MRKRVTVKMRKYTLIRRAAEEGCAVASHRFSKHLEPNLTLEELNREQLAEVFCDAVMNSLSEIIDFEDELT